MLVFYVNLTFPTIIFVADACGIFNALRLKYSRSSKNTRTQVECRDFWWTDVDHNSPMEYARTLLIISGSWRILTEPVRH